MAWSSLDEERLRRIHRNLPPAEGAEEFMRKLSILFKNKSIGSIREKCRRMNLEAKVVIHEEKPGNTVKCSFCEKDILKGEKTTKNMHRNCYTKSWRLQNL